MKKFAVILACVTTIFCSLTPALADVSAVPATGNLSFFSTFEELGSSPISTSGSLAEGSTYSVTATFDCPSTNTYTFDPIPPSTTGETHTGVNVGIAKQTLAEAVTLTTLAGGNEWHDLQAQPADDPKIPMNSGPLIAGPAGSSSYFAAIANCLYYDFSGGTASWTLRARTRIIKVTFESPIGSPSNFMVTPQAGGSVFATWGVASGATSYTIQTAPGGGTCTTSQNFCTISGLTDGTTYTFSLNATNGSQTSSIGSGPILYREPIDVKASVDSPNWKVGETVTANYTIHGSPPYTTTVTWYRCDRIVPPTQVAPVECTTIRSGSSNTYTLVSADLGKYITAYVSSTNGASTQGKTAPGATAVLAANAVVPTPSPDGKPTIVAIPNATVPVSGGTEIIISGTGLAGVTSVTIGGVLAEIVSKTDNAITVKVPTSSQTGAADVVVTNDKGSATKASAVVYTSNQTPSPAPTTSPVTPKSPATGVVTKTLSIANFAVTQVKLTTAQKSAVKKLVTSNPTLTKLVCTAKSTGPKMTAKDLAVAEARAAATCSYAASLRTNLYVNATGTAGISKATSRNVTLTLKN